MTSTRKQKKAQTTVGAVSREQQHKEAEARSTHNGHEQGLHIHTLHANVPIPYFTPGDLGANAKAATSKLPSLPGMPPPRRLAFYGGLGALVVTGLVDLPVAVAIGVATVIARGGGEERRPQEQPAKAETAGAGGEMPKTSQTTQTTPTPPTAPTERPAGQPA